MSETMDKVIAERSGVNARGQSYIYRVVQRLPVNGRREYWLQLSRPDLPWMDVRGPYWQRPAAWRKRQDEVERGMARQAQKGLGLRGQE